MAQLSDNSDRRMTRAIHGLTMQQADIIAASVAQFENNLEIERHYCYDGHLSLMLFHLTEDRTYIVDRDSDGLHIGTMDGEILKVGVRPYKRPREVIQALMNEFDKDAAAARQLSA